MLIPELVAASRGRLKRGTVYVTLPSVFATAPDGKTVFSPIWMRTTPGCAFATVTWFIGGRQHFMHGERDEYTTKEAEEILADE